MALRGFDDYEVTLGDEMRGERACLGKTLDDAERDLCIRAEMLSAIENCDLDAFPNPSVIPGYVRAYARYLGLNPDTCYKRFCEVSGYRSPASSFGVVQDEGDGRRAVGLSEAAAVVGVGAALTQSRFANTPRTRRIGARVSFGGLFSAVALVGLVGGLGYGGYALLQDIQRVGFAPLPEAPAVVADAPVIEAPELAESFPTRPDASAYAGGGALAAVMPSELPMPARPRRDGPISAIDPLNAGVFASLGVGQSDPADPRDPREPMPVFASVTPVPQAEAQLQVASANAESMNAAADLPPPQHSSAKPEKPSAGQNQVALVAVDDAWVRIRDASSAVIFEGILKPGQSYDLPERVEGPVLRAGNAGGVFVTIGGVPHGPLGASGAVVKNISLHPDDVKTAWPEVARLPGVGTADLRSASAAIDR